MDYSVYLPLSLMLGAFGAWSVIRVAGGYGLIDHPGHRSSHIRPTPKGGGVGILLAFAAISLLVDIPASLWIPVVLVSLVGLLGDRIDLSMTGRFALQFVCALVAIFGQDFQLDQLVPDSPLWGLIGVVFVVGTANTFNFMDGINGMAGITAILAFGLLTIYGLTMATPQPYIVLNLSIVFACIGFLPFNLPQAKVFMGDTGSVMLGFLFAIMVWKTDPTLLGVLTGATFLFLVYADTISTIAIRYVQGDDILVPHRRHLYQVAVNEIGLPHWLVATAYGGVQLLIGLLALVLHGGGVVAVVCGLIVLGSIFVLTSVVVRRRADRLQASGPH